MNFTNIIFCITRTASELATQALWKNFFKRRNKVKKIFLVTIIIFQTFHFAGAVENSANDVENKGKNRLFITD